MKIPVANTSVVSCGVISLALLVGIPSEPLAQQFSPAVLEEIVVTARRREESLAVLPLSVAVMDAGEMQARNIFSIDDITEFVPNLNLSEGRTNLTSVVIRGIGGGSATPTTVIGSGMYIDGHYMPNSRGGYMSTLDIERVEVMRGPQGTLYGKNVIGGAVNIISVKPQPVFDSSVLLRVAEDGDENFRGMLNVPFSDTVYGRFSFATETFDGYYYNRFLDRDAGKEEIRTLNAALRFQPNDDWTIDASFSASEQRDDTGAGQCFGDPNGDAPQWGGGPGQLERRLYAGAKDDFIALCAADVSFGDFVNSSEKASFANVDVESAFLSVQHVLSDTLQLRVNTSVRNVEDWYLNDRDLTPWPLDSRGTADISSRTTTDTLSFEVLLEGSPNNRLQYTAGVHYFDETTHAGGNDDCYHTVVALTDPAQVGECAVSGILFELVPDNPSGLGLWPNGPRIDSGGPAPFFVNVSVFNESLGIFGHATYALNESWTFDVGARWTQDKRRFNNIEFPATGCDLSLDPRNVCPFSLPVSQQFVADNGFFNAASGTFDAVTPMISLTRTIAPSDSLDSGMLYFLYSRGFLTGGFNTELNSNLPAVQPFLAFQPEHVDNYEVGFKGAFFHGKLRLMADVFYMNYTDQQQPVDLANPDFLFGSDDSIAIVQNVASSHLYGLELELRAIPWDAGFVAVEVGTLKHSSYDEYFYVDPGTGAVTDLANLPNDPLGPEWTVTVAAEHTFLLGASTLTPRLGVYWQDRYDWSPGTPNSICDQDGYARVDARLTYEPAEGDWRVALYGQNINDERALESCQLGRNVFLGQHIRPKHWGLEFAMRFGGD